MILLIVNIFVIIVLIVAIAFFGIRNKKYLTFDSDLEILINKVNSIRYGNLSIKIGKFKENRFKKLSESINRLADTLNDREKMITEYQGELTRQNKFLEAVINSLSDGILIVDGDYNISVITPQISNWFQNDEKNIIGKNISEFIQAKNDDILVNEEVFIKNSSDVFMADLRPLELNDDKQRFVIILKNITDQKEIEQLKDDFVATLTHDLKVPIIAESNILEFLLKGKFGEISDKQTEALSNMKHSNAELLELVQILLETYRIDKSGIELYKEEVYIEDFIKEIVNEMSSILDKAKIKIDVNTQKKIAISIDKIHFKRVLKNLIQNAVSHSDSQNNIDIKIENNKNEVNIKVIDYGKGISKEDLKHIFKKYYSTAKKFRKIGTGLGLFLSLQIIQAHGGEITVKSEENKRTEFCINLPMQTK